ncbi:MAG: DegT/DnrJ/EryC1/StrS family aminotransferase [Sphaerochaeta sp.]|nr:DegT/DnrJ/EryC1/StrS family aminotransferase [Sphaerochaeta sp.]
MEFRDLKQQYQVLKDKMDKAVLEVMTDCNFISGRQVKELEKQLAEYVGIKHCVTCANGTDALTMMLMAWGIGPGDAVFVPDFTFFASGEVVSFEGATPVFVDVDPDTFNMDFKSLEKAILAVKKEGKLVPRVVIPVDLFGLCADYDAITGIAHKYGVKVLEDGAQGFGGLYKGKRACSFGDAATTSFFPAKPLGCYGDGGAIFTNDDKTADYLRSIAVHGKGSFKYDNIRIGWNSRLDTIQAAVLLVKFDAMKEYELEDINRVAFWYTEALKDVCKTPVVPEGYYSSWAQYTIQLESEEQRNQIQASLKEKNIPTMVYYPKPMHEQTAFKGLHRYVECPVTEKLCKTVLALPLDPYKTREDVGTVSQLSI